MIASASSRAGLALALGLAALGCAGNGVVPWLSPMEELPRFALYMPDSGDRVLHDAAAASLLSDAEALESVEAAARALDAERYDAGEPPTGLLPYVLEARNATLPDAPSRRRAAAEMLRRDDLPPETRARMEIEVEDDPLRLARSRVRDARRARFARIFNALVEPVGRSLSNFAMLPMRVAQALVNLAIQEYKAPDLSTAERQALDHWKDFIERNPDSSEALALLPRVEKTQRRWYRMMRDASLGKARKALRAGRPSLALSRARQALSYAPEDEDVLGLAERARRRVELRRRDRERSLQVDPAAVSPDAALRGLAVALLLPGGDLEGAAAALEARDPEGRRRDEIAFARALALAERGEETDMWEALEEVEDDRRSNMARHARQLRIDPQTNPYGAYKRARASMRNDRLRWLLLGPLARGPRSLDLPRPVEWLATLPSLPKVVYGLPNRLLRFPLMKSQRKSAGVFARQYLERAPSGDFSGEVRDWLTGYEEARGNFVGALRVAEGAGGDPEELEKLRERAARQAYDAAVRETRFDSRVGLLNNVAKSFPGTDYATRAGKQVRREVEEATPQQIRISRGFLDENPRLMGPEGLALRPEVLDGDDDNGELHPDGVRILSGEWLEFAYVAEDGNDRDEPEWRRAHVSKERMARLVALLEDSAIRNSLLDKDFQLRPDADRDLFFERARLGVADKPHPSAAARSTFAFEGMRETYGLVRSRESILPVEIVLQGSLQDFGLGAFPRIRMPKETPDAFLFR